MGEVGIAGVTRTRRAPRTTVPDQNAAGPKNLVDRHFGARPNQLWVATLPCCPRIEWT